MKTQRNKSPKRPLEIEALLNIHSLGAQGDGLSIYNDKTVYVEQSLADEAVQAVLKPESGGIYRARAKTTIKSSPDRVQPPCRHFSKCGGCRLQHMAMPAYHSWKIDTVRSYLTTKNIIPVHWGDPVFIPPHTRRRVTFSALKQKDALIMGFHQRQSNILFNLKECHLLSPDLEALLPALRELLSPLMRDKQNVSIFLQQAENGIDMVLTGQIGANCDPDLSVLEAITDFANHHVICRISWRIDEKQKPETLIEFNKPYVTFGNLQVPIAPLAFLQPSKDGEDALVQTVLTYLDEIKDGKVADIFAGCGTFTGRIAEAGLSVDAYEGEAVAIAQLKAAGHIQAYGRDLFREPLTVRELQDYDCVVIDPPRAGAKAQSEALEQSDVPLIIAVSCNPATFARDARILLGGGYRLERVTIIDQFVWSAHAELVAKFVR